MWGLLYPAQGNRDYSKPLRTASYPLSQLPLQLGEAECDSLLANETAEVCWELLGKPVLPDEKGQMLLAPFAHLILPILKAEMKPGAVVAIS